MSRFIISRAFLKPTDSSIQEVATGNYKGRKTALKGLDFIFATTSRCLQTSVRLTIDDSGHSPETQQDEEAEAIKGVLVEDEHNVQHEGNDHDQTVKHLKLVLEKLPAVGVEFAEELHHEKGQEGQAEVVKNLQGQSSTLLVSGNSSRRGLRCVVEGCSGALTSGMTWLCSSLMTERSISSSASTKKASRTTRNTTATCSKDK